MNPASVRDNEVVDRDRRPTRRQQDGRAGAERAGQTAELLQEKRKNLRKIRAKFVAYRFARGFRAFLTNSSVKVPTEHRWTVSNRRRSGAGNNRTVVGRALSKTESRAERASGRVSSLILDPTESESSVPPRRPASCDSTLGTRVHATNRPPYSKASACCPFGSSNTWLLACASIKPFASNFIGLQSIDRVVATITHFFLLFTSTTT